jgi:galactonate dehydratase
VFDRRPNVKITRIETFQVPPRWLFVRVESDEGLVGWGEASLEGYAEAVEGALEAFKERFLDFDPYRIEEIWQIGYRGGFYRGGPVLLSALSGLEQALWDLKGKALGLPVWEMLGGRVRERVQAYAWIGGDRPQEVGEATRARKAHGFRAVKMNATAELGYLESPKVLDTVLERVEAVQREGLDVALDFHGRVHKPMAKQLIKLLEPYRPLFIEEPLLSEHPEAIRELAQVSSVPIALGERLYTRWGFKPFLASGLVDVIQPDISHAGGILETKKISAIAEVYDVAVAPHCPLGPLALASCLQLAACTPNVVLQEMSLGIHYNETHDLLTYVASPEVFTVQAGFLSIPEGPGLGVELNEVAIHEASQNKHRWRNPIWKHQDGSFAEW